VEKKEDITISNSLVPWLGKTMKLIDNTVEDILSENNIDLSRIQFIVLKNINQNDGISQNELAFFVNRNKSTLTRMLTTLEKKQYIIKQHCKEDKRKFRVHLSNLGKEILKESEPYFTEFAVKMEQGISPEDRIKITELLNKIQNNIIGENPSPFIKNRI
jgi:DNA-binding MarR family transcriptional regulator